MKVTYIDHMGTDLSVVNAARVSFDKRHETFDEVKDPRLINFLAREGHTSPFNHTFLTMHVKAPIYVARQLVKHKFMPWNEMSGRYVQFGAEFHHIDEYRSKAVDKKQGSGEPIVDDSQLRLIFAENHHECFLRYMDAIQQGLCEEQARSLLPIDLMTQWYWSGTLGAWSDMFRLRSKNDAQLESQEIARQAGEIIAPLYPVSWKALTA